MKFTIEGTTINIFRTEDRLACDPLSETNLHKMGKFLDLKRCWHEEDHYILPNFRKIKGDKVLESSTLISDNEFDKLIQG